ncbi:hypothetical protein L249_2781 [Ophiocordyceps polyrhachis-furcata BCC 54312]|uniref:Uncharacterized protein n=1 Tax=Ophiocordyceps polyrhachis-furcata BCC 54312 TaxID=1330021 RepID=A0A367LQC3_9HYPO|nr:hypothetical protein L249_2781 [Ophiocordyceps polyrhachis-furcata BCC 54312]
MKGGREARRNGIRSWRQDDDEGVSGSYQVACLGHGLGGDLSLWSDMGPCRVNVWVQGVSVGGRRAGIVIALEVSMGPVRVITTVHQPPLLRATGYRLQRLQATGYYTPGPTTVLLGGRQELERVAKLSMGASFLPFLASLTVLPRLPRTEDQALPTTSAHIKTHDSRALDITSRYVSHRRNGIRLGENSPCSSCLCLDLRRIEDATTANSFLKSSTPQQTLAIAEIDMTSNYGCHRLCDGSPCHIQDMWLSNQSSMAVTSHDIKLVPERDRFPCLTKNRNPLDREEGARERWRGGWTELRHGHRHRLFSTVGKAFCFSSHDTSVHKPLGRGMRRNSPLPAGAVVIGGVRFVCATKRWKKKKKKKKKCIQNFTLHTRRIVPSWIAGSDDEGREWGRVTPESDLE